MFPDYPFTLGTQLSVPWTQTVYGEHIVFERHGRSVQQLIHFFDDDCEEWIFVESPRNILRTLKQATRKEIIMLDLLKKSASKVAGKVQTFELEDKAFCKDYPNLYVYLAANVGPDQKPRERATVSFFCEGNCWKASLNDKDARASLFITIKSPQDVFKALEMALDKDAPDWRVWRNPERGKGK